MAYICIKTNDRTSIKYLLSNYKNTNTIHHLKRFKNYYNFFIYYKDKQKLIYNFSSILSTYIQNSLEDKILNKMFDANYFYFDKSDKIKIMNEYKIFRNNINDENNIKKLIENPITEFLFNNKYMNLEGFINFRLLDYHSFLNDLLSTSINKYIIDQEYFKYVNLLKEHVQTSKDSLKTINLLYVNGNGILLDENLNYIKLDELENKYFSDISFSKNDNILNTLIGLLPHKINLHLLSDEDQFIKNIKIIFEGKVCTCSGCKLCKSLSKISNHFQHNFE